MMRHLRTISAAFLLLSSACADTRAYEPVSLETGTDAGVGDKASGRISVEVVPGKYTVRNVRITACPQGAQCRRNVNIYSRRSATISVPEGAYVVAVWADLYINGVLVYADSYTPAFHGTAQGFVSVAGESTVGFKATLSQNWGGR